MKRSVKGVVCSRHLVPMRRMGMQFRMRRIQFDS